MSLFVDIYWGALQPRVGLAYSPDSKTVIRAGSGLFFDRYNMTFFFVPGNQKTVPGYLEDKFVLPMVHKKAASGGWQVNLVAPIASLSQVADAAKDIILTGQYQPYYASGPCPPACSVGAGGMDRHENKLPYAVQASLQIDRKITQRINHERCIRVDIMRKIPKAFI